MKVALRPHRTMKDAGWYTLDYRPNGAKGKREREHCESYELAMERKAVLEGGKRETVSPRFSDIVDEYLAWCDDNLAPDTMRGKRTRLKRHIMPALGRYRVKDLSQRVLDGYFAGKTKATIVVDLSHIQALITWMVKRRYAEKLTWDPERPKYHPGVKPVPYPEEIITFISTLKKAVHREACWLMLQTALRWDELRHVRWENYREAPPLLIEEAGKIYGTWIRMGEINLIKTKTHQSEPVTFPLTPWWDENRKAEGPIFSVRQGKMLSTIHRQLKEHSDRIGIKMSPHVFRHACGTYLYEQTGDIRAVQQQLRHSKLATTEIYVRKSVVRKRASSKVLVGTFKMDELKPK